MCRRISCPIGAPKIGLKRSREIFNGTFGNWLIQGSKDSKYRHEPFLYNLILAPHRISNNGYRWPDKKTEHNVFTIKRQSGNSRIKDLPFFCIVVLIVDISNNVTTVEGNSSMKYHKMQGTTVSSTLASFSTVPPTLASIS